MKIQLQTERRQTSYCNLIPEVQLMAKEVEGNYKIKIECR
jgi:hypothetical protein